MADNIAISEQPWRKYLTDYNEGLGLVYERFILNDFLEDLRQEHGLESVLVQVQPDGWGELPFEDGQFDMAWTWAALWYIQDPAALLNELARVSRKLVFVAMPNNIQVGYWMRKLVIDREFFQNHDESWTHIGRIRRILESAGIEIIQQGVLDVPPWPDTVMPANEVLKRLGIRSSKLEERFTGDDWHWSTMAYYMGEQPDLRERVMKYAWLDHAKLPWQIKSIWAHHRYLLGQVTG